MKLTLAIILALVLYPCLKFGACCFLEDVGLLHMEEKQAEKQEDETDEKES